MGSFSEPTTRRIALLTYGDFTYTYRNSGELETKTHVPSGDTTSYSYDEFGNLLEVVLPDGTDITYVVDGENRRVGKRVNGTLAQAFVYEDQLRIAAELDGSGTIAALFAFSESANSPDYALKSGSYHRISKDHLGSPRLVVDVANGVITQRMDYDDFGVVMLDLPAGFQPFGFAGGLFEQRDGPSSIRRA